MIYDPRPPTALSALAAEVAADQRGRGLSSLIVRAMTTVARKAGLAPLVAPVRPSWKDRYPLTPIDRYVTWRRSDGLPFDPWLRVHARLGATILRPEPRSLQIESPVADWEQWTEMTFPQDGEYRLSRGARATPSAQRHRLVLGAERVDGPRGLAMPAATPPRTPGPPIGSGANDSAPSSTRHRPPPELRGGGRKRRHRARERIQPRANLLQAGRARRDPRQRPQATRPAAPRQMKPDCNQFPRPVTGRGPSLTTRPPRPGLLRTRCRSLGVGDGTAGSGQLTRPGGRANWGSSTFAPSPSEVTGLCRAASPRSGSCRPPLHRPGPDQDRSLHASWGNAGIHVTGPAVQGLRPFVAGADMGGVGG